jgi:hypothetical protein
VSVADQTYDAHEAELRQLGTAGVVIVETRVLTAPESARAALRLVGIHGFENCQEL